MYKPYIHWNYFILLTHKRKKTTPKHSLESGPYTLDLFIQTLHCRELIGRISILLSWLSVIIILAYWNAFLDIRDAPWWYRIDVSSLWQTIFSTSIMDNYKRFALSEKNADKMPHKHYKFFIADFQSKFYLFTKSICHNL